MAEQNHEKQNVVSFLIAEHSEINEEHRRLRDEGVRRMTFYITLTSAIVGGLALFADKSSLSTSTLLLFSMGAFTLLALIGWPTFQYLIARDTGTDFNVRAMSRIRKYFVDEYPSIEPYVLWDIDDQPTWYIDREKLPSTLGTVAMIISFLVCLDAVLLPQLVLEILSLGTRIEYLAPSAGLGLVAFIITFVWLRSQAMNEFQAAVQSARESANLRLIQDYVKSQHDCAVKTCWVGHVMHDNGLRPEINPAWKYGGKWIDPCPSSKRPFVEEALRHYQMI